MIFKFNPEKYRKDFPILSKKIIYFDNACMSLKPKQVIDKMNEYYLKYTGCAGRSSHRFSKKVEEEVERARVSVKKLINAKKALEIIFTRNTTEGINLVANGLDFKQGDEVIISDKEHNSNLIPWLKLKKEKGIKLVVINSNEDNTFNLKEFGEKINSKTKLVSIVHTSNLDGVTNPIKEISKISHENNALLLVDGAQGVPGKRVDVKDLDIDFLSFSGHKMLGPSGIGVLYGKEHLLKGLNQFIVGGETVKDSTYEEYEIEDLPMKFEAGLQDYAGIIGMGEACRYLEKVGLKNIEEHEIKLNSIITKELGDYEKIQIIGPKDSKKRSGIFSFNIKGVDPHNISKILDVSKNIMTRSGAHCVHSWFNKHNLQGSVRASMYFYNTEEEVRVFAEEVKKLLELC